MTTAETTASDDLRRQKLSLPPRHHSHSEVYSLQTDKELEYSPNCQRANQRKFTRANFRKLSPRLKSQWPASASGELFSGDQTVLRFFRFLSTAGKAFFRDSRSLFPRPRCPLKIEVGWLSLACRVVLLRRRRCRQRAPGEFLIDFFHRCDEGCFAAQERPTHPTKLPRLFPLRAPGAR